MAAGSSTAGAGATCAAARPPSAMAVTVKIFTKHGGRPTLFQSRDFHALPGTIGRDATRTLALDDPPKHISRAHVEVEEEDGTYWVSGVSEVKPGIVKGPRYRPR